MVKAAFFDIDGTLYSHRTNSVPASTRDALKRLRQKGVLIFLATGRSRGVLEDLPALREIPFDGAVTLNGAYCYDHVSLIHHDPIHPGDIRALLSWLKENPTPCAFIEGDKTYINFHDDRVHAVHAAIHTPLLPLGDLERGHTQPVYQILLYLNDRHQHLLPSMPHTRHARWHNGGLDIFPATCGKATGIRKILAHYGISPEETIAFGDAENDLDMFQAAGCAVAMGNASPAVQNAAHYVTADVDDDGILLALEHYGLI